MIATATTAPAWVVVDQRDLNKGLPITDAIILFESATLAEAMATAVAWNKQTDPFLTSFLVKPYPQG